MRLHKVALVAPIAVASLLGGAVRADTTGDYLLNGNGVLTLLGFPAPIEQPSGFDDPANFTAVDLNSSVYALIQNEYMAVVLGQSGTFGVPYDEGQVANLIGFSTATTLTHNVAGMLTFGNIGGNLRGTADNFQALNGFNAGEFYYASGQPAGYGVWPLPGYWQGANTYDYSAYTRANVDGITVNGQVTGGTNVNVGFADGDLILPPVFRDNVLEANYRLTAGNPVVGDDGAVTLRQRITLLRNTARIEWTLSNYDTEAHRVSLRFTVNQRPGGLNAFEQFAAPRYGVFYQDPSQGGVTDRVTIFGANPDGLPATPVPDSIEIYGKRVEGQDPNDPPYHSRFLYRGFGATLPTTVYVADPDEFYPTDGGFSPATLAQGRVPLFEDGLAVVNYYGPFDLRAGAADQVTIVAYYGNGSSSDRLEQDWALGTEAEEAFQYNAAAALDPAVVGNTSATYSTVARKFLTPSPLPVYGSLYNRSLNAPPGQVNLDNVSLSLVLPSGLQFATNPATGQTDIATKSLGTLLPDRDGTTQWLVEPTGDTFGTVVYQMTGTVGGTGQSRTVSRPVVIPATPLYPVTASSYQMIGFPFQFDPILSNNGDPATVVNGLSRPVDDPVSFYRWIPEDDGVTGRYERVSKLEPGEGYFYRPNLDRLLFLRGVQPFPDQAPSNGASGTRLQKTLERGWNMISNPFLYEIPVGYLRFADPNGGNPVPFGQAVNSGVVRGGVFFYNPTTRRYDFFDRQDQTLRPYQGYWIYLNDRRIIQFAPPAQRQSAILPDATTGAEPPTRKVVGAIASGRALVANPALDNWKVQLVASRADGSGDNATLVGVSSAAKDGDDIRDLPKPPTIVEDYVYMSVVREQDGKTTRFAQDMKTPGGKKTWELEVRADKDGPVTLTWPNIARMPKRLRLRLTDTATGRVTDLKSASSVVVNVAKGQPSRFVLTSDLRASTALAITNLRVDRVPGSRAQGGGSAYNFRFNVTTDASITGQVLTMTNKPVSTFAVSRAASSKGENRLTWNGRSEAGAALAAGPYVVVLSARTSDGEVITVRRPIQVLK